jgi:hypothetical protein
MLDQLKVGELMLVFDYPSKKALKEAIGQKLRYRETSLFGEEYLASGNLVGCNRPHITGHKREFFAEVTVSNHLIVKVK